MEGSSSEDEGMAILEACLPSERVTIHVYSNPSSHYFYFYLTFIKNMRIFLTFFSFITEVLNVAPSHMLPNSYDFIKDFEMVWEGLETFPKVGIFFSFYAIKPSRRGWMSLGGVLGRDPFKPHSNHYKN